MAKVGMDTARMQSVVKFLDGQVAQLDSLIRELDGAATGVDWTGPDAEKFKRTEWPAAKTKLDQARKVLEQARQTLNANRVNQDKVSDR